VQFGGSRSLRYCERHRLRVCVAEIDVHVRLAGLGVVEPVVHQPIPIGIGGTARCEFRLRAGAHLDPKNIQTAVPVQNRSWRMVSPAALRHRAPVHSSSEVALERRPPAPNRRTRVSYISDAILRVCEVPVPHASKAPTPASPLRVFGVAEAIAQKVEPRRGVSFLHRAMRIGSGPGFRRIQRPDRSVPVPHVRVEPGQ
jgi:hypothetical protein